MTTNSNVVGLEINFTLPFTSKEVFEFVIKPDNMHLYTGFFLIPGIVDVKSSDAERKVGTVDQIANTDKSSHQSTTIELEDSRLYGIRIENITLRGWKQKLGAPIIGFRERWVLSDHEGVSHIHRTLDILFVDNFFNRLFVKYFVYPQLYISFLFHHQNVKKGLNSYN